MAEHHQTAGTQYSLAPKKVWDFRFRVPCPKSVKLVLRYQRATRTAIPQINDFVIRTFRSSKSSANQPNYSLIAGVLHSHPASSITSSSATPKPIVLERACESLDNSLARVASLAGRQNVQAL